MRKITWLSFFITLLLIALGVVSVSALQDTDEGLSFNEPTACPSSGCAAGQRLNFNVHFSVEPQFTGGPNTKVCVYAPADGTAESGTLPWADSNESWIAEDNPAYTTDRTDSVCMNAAPPNTEFLIGAFATHTTEKIEQIEFATLINKTTNIAGEFSVKIFQVDLGGSNWNETTTPTATFSNSIPVAPVSQTAFAAEEPVSCGAFSPCFVHSGDDKPGGKGTSLYDAVQALEPGGEILILKDLRIKTHPITIDKNLNIKGHNQESMLTSINTSQACGNALLSFQAGGVLQNITINDGNCPSSNARTLVEVNSPDKVTIKNTTLTSGKTGIHVRNNNGEVHIAFNQLSNNQEKAIFIDAGSTSAGRVNIYANNIINNGADAQVSCSSGGIANHNFWGEGQLPTENTTNCLVKNGQELGAPILTASNGHGVQGVLGAVTGSYNYFFNGKIGARHSEGDDFNIVIVNHGQGKDVNIPFFESGSGYIVPCGNFYDVFLADNADPKNLHLAIKYDLNQFCINTIESDFYCGNSNQTRYPLWWYDPLNNVTDGWDRTGQAPEGTSSGGDIGQVTVCNTSQDEIIVTIDNTGRPGLFSDLNFTPFVAGFIEGASLTDFSAAFTNYYTRVSWQTSWEKNIKRYEVLRSNKINSGYEVVEEINVNNDTTTSNTYQFYDYDVSLSSTYYYKLHVIYDNEENEIIGRYGPLTLKIAAPTITATPTVTRTRFPTSTPFYRTPTRAYYRSATPAGAPTQVRTYGPAPTYDGTNPPSEAYPASTMTPISDSGYPSGEDEYPTEPGYPVGEDQTITPNQTAEGQQGTKTPTPDEADTIDGEAGKQKQAANQSAPRWTHLLIGLAGGLALLLVASVIMAKSIFL